MSLECYSNSELQAELDRREEERRRAKLEQRLARNLIVCNNIDAIISLYKSMHPERSKYQERVLAMLEGARLDNYLDPDWVVDIVVRNEPVDTL